MDDWQQILAWGQSSSPKEQKQQKKDTGKNVDGLEAVLPQKKKKRVTLGMARMFNKYCGISEHFFPIQKDAVRILFEIVLNLSIEFWNNLHYMILSSHIHRIFFHLFISFFW